VIANGNPESHLDIVQLLINSTVDLNTFDHNLCKKSINVGLD
jgi:hypothetical protein